MAIKLKQKDLNYIINETVKRVLKNRKVSLRENDMMMHDEFNSDDKNLSKIAEKMLEDCIKNKDYDIVNQEITEVDGGCGIGYVIISAGYDGWEIEASCDAIFDWQGDWELSTIEDISEGSFTSPDGIEGEF